MQLSYDYDRRVADASPTEVLKTSFRFKWGYDALRVSLLVNRKLAGRLLMALVHPDALAREDCQKDVDALATKGHAAKSFWAVENVDILEAFRHKGLGKLLYEAGFHEVSKKKGPVYVGPYSCEGHGTSAAADRVWDSLAHKYPSSGHVLYVR